MNQKYERESSNIISLLSDLVEENNIIRANQLGTMNLFEINNISHLELYHSNILNYLITPNEAHNHKEFGQQFLEIIYQKIENINNKDTSINYIKREQTITVENAGSTRKRFIDLYIETENYKIIIENKIKADDLDNQLIDYYEKIKEKHPRNKKIILCYLTLFGNNPNNKSLTVETINQINEDKNYYVLLSYKKDILNWLEQLNSKAEEKELTAAIIQYKDILKELCNLKENKQMEEHNIINKMVENYSNLQTIHKIHDLQNTIEKLTLGTHYLLYKNFLQQLLDVISNKMADNKINNKLYLIHSSKEPHSRLLYNNNLNELENYLKRNQYKYFGFEIALEDTIINIQPNSGKIGLAFELQTLDAKSFIAFGIMYHNFSFNNSFQLSKEWENTDDYYRIYRDNPNMWKEYIKIEWILRKIYNNTLTKEDVELIAKWIIDELMQNNGSVTKLRLNH